MVKRIIDQIEIGELSSFSQETHDAYITAKVKLELLDISLPSFDPSRVKVVTELSVVYLMGLVNLLRHLQIIGIIPGGSSGCFC